MKTLWYIVLFLADSDFCTQNIEMWVQIFKNESSNLAVSNPISSFKLFHIKQTPSKTEFVINYCDVSFLFSKWIFNIFCYFKWNVLFLYQLPFLQYNLTVNKKLNSSFNIVDGSQDELSIWKFQTAGEFFGEKYW